MFAEIPELLKWKVGYAADPAIDILLDKVNQGCLSCGRYVA